MISEGRNRKAMQRALDRGEYFKAFELLGRREWFGRNFIALPVGFGWWVNVEWEKRNNDAEALASITFQVVKPK
jgi:hypothetical protein